MYSCYEFVFFGPFHIEFAWVLKRDGVEGMDIRKQVEEAYNKQNVDIARLVWDDYTNCDCSGSSRLRDDTGIPRVSCAPSAGSRWPEKEMLINLHVFLIWRAIFWVSTIAFSLCLSLFHLI